MIKDLKHWYHRHDNKFLSEILEYYDKENLMIKTYSTIFKLSNNEYALCLVKFHPTLNSPKESHVQTLYFHKGQKTELKNIQVWLAKYFGLYFKEKRCLDFTEADFDGKDIKVALDFPSELDNVNENTTILSQKDLKFNLKPTDTNNSAIYCLGYCLTRMKKKKASSTMGRTEKELSKFAKNFRLCTLSLICDIYELFNKN